MSKPDKPSRRRDQSGKAATRTPATNGACKSRPAAMLPTGRQRSHSILAAGSPFPSGDRRMGNVQLADDVVAFPFGDEFPDFGIIGATQGCHGRHA